MLFNSYIFILCFFPICLAGYFGLNHFKKYHLGQAFLLGMSLWFYGYFNPSYLIIMLSSIVLNYFAAWLMKKTEHQRLRKTELIVTLLGNIAVLFYFKYYDFFISNINQVFGSDFTLLHVMLPLGISFFTFQQISFIVDAYRGEVSQYNFLQYASFVAYFPQLIAGPIVTHDELIPQFMDESKKKFNWENFCPGIFLFSLGLGKKVLIADLFGKAVSWGFGNIAALDSTNAVLVVLAYTFQVYFDFSGYCDMAIGLGKMMNIDLPLNFDSPYKAVTITEFWTRWHKTLTRFFTKYIYIPLGGNRRGMLRTYCNVLIVYFVSGLWHGANWTFLLWGCLHGIGSVLTRHGKQKIEKLPRWFCWLMTFVFLNITWIFFRADSIADGFAMLQRITAWEFGPVSNEIKGIFNVLEVVYLMIWGFNVDLNATGSAVMTVLIYGLTFLGVLFAPNAYERMRKFRYRVWELLVAAVLLVWCIFSLSGVSTFLYFNF